MQSFNGFMLSLNRPLTKACSKTASVYSARAVTTDYGNAMCSLKTAGTGSVLPEALKWVHHEHTAYDVKLHYSTI